MDSIKFTKPLSQKQTRLVVFIHDYIEKNNYPPSHKELQELMGVTSVNNQVTSIVKKGWLIRNNESRNRNLSLTNEGKKRVDSLRTEPDQGFDSS